MKKREDIERDDRAVMDLLTQYCVFKNGCSYLKTRTHGLIHLVDISDAIWDEGLRQQKKESVGS